MKNMPRLLRAYLPYSIMLTVNLLFLILAFIVDTPSNIFGGFAKIITSRSILVTDYIAVGGLGAALLNAAIVGFLSITMFLTSGVKPSGAAIMALWVTAGFSFFGKNVFNMIPLTCGVWLFSKYNREPFSNYSLSALLAATVSPVISEISFLGMFSTPIEIIAGILLGFLIGFIFPPISAESMKVHSGYDLYNMGFTGGLVATIFATIFKSMGIKIEMVNIWSGNNNLILAVLLYTVSAMLFCFGLIGGAKKNLADFPKIFKHSGRLVTDFYFLYSNSVYINMAVLGTFATTLVLIIGADLNGTVLAGIFTIIGFGSFGKHLRNITPVLTGAVISAYLNHLDFAYPSNIMAILFSTCLAPIAGQFGWTWGILAGFLHVNVAVHISTLNSGLNLYNNGFAAGIVAMFLLPLIIVFRKDKDKDKDKNDKSDKNDKNDKNKVETDKNNSENKEKNQA